jgi:hypothetical protein
MDLTGVKGDGAPIEGARVMSGFEGSTLRC